MRTRTAALALATVMLVGACGSNNAGNGGPYGAGGGSTVSSPSPSPQASSSDGGSGRYGYGTGGGYGSSSPSKSGGGGPVALTVTQSNYAFTPATVKVASGASIEIRNGTTGTPHTFTITGKGIDVTVDPGSSQDVSIDLPAGTYAFECRFHASLGMKGTLTVR